jgi:DNA-binding transcriptional LysR family regulator
MQFSVLRYFLETARLGSIRGAAEKLNVAPSAVSRQIALLEDSYGMPLFERHAAGMRLTAAGGAFARQAHATVRDFERLRSEIDDLQQLRRGTVRVFTVEAAFSILGRAMADFALEYPGISFEVQMATGIPVIEAVAAERCDIAIGFMPLRNPDVEEVQSLRDPIVAIMHPTHPLASRTKVSLPELADHPVALLDESNATRGLLDQAVAQEGLSLRTVATVSHAGVGLALVRSNLAMMFLPGLGARADVEAGLVKTVLVDHPTLLGTRIVLCRHRSRPPTLPAQAFLLALARQFSRFELEAPAPSGAA